MIDIHSYYHLLIYINNITQFIILQILLTDQWIDINYTDFILNICCWDLIQTFCPLSCDPSAIWKFEIYFGFSEYRISDYDYMNYNNIGTLTIWVFVVLKNFINFKIIKFLRLNIKLNNHKY